MRPDRSVAGAILVCACVWRYKPASRGGKPVAVYYTVSFRIHLR